MLNTLKKVDYARLVIGFKKNIPHYLVFNGRYDQRFVKRLQHFLESPAVAGDKKKKSKVAHETRCLLKDLNDMLTVFWPVIPDQINSANKSIHQETIELRTVIDPLNLLSDFLMPKREIFDECVMSSGMNDEN